MDQQLIQLLVNGIATGSIIALAAVGLTLTYGILRLANFAHGDLMTLGAYLTLLINANGANIWLSMIVGAVATVGAALVSEKLLWSPMRDRRATSTTLIIISIGLALFIRNGIILFWGGDNQAYNLPVATALDIFGIKIAYYRIVVVALAILAILGLHYLLQNTKIGKAMRAVADNIDLARVSGINVDQVVIWTWVIAAGLTALGGGMYGLITAVRPNMGWFLILPMFASVILGGIGNPYGAIAGAFVIGIAQEVGTYWLPTEYKLGVALFIMILVLLIRPQGLFRGTI
ncbi:branched-chain amino acid ABC transporter permease [Oculatella sp. FACHB-28]|uniref:branched-chain amino acid ABC transporter permease n=1 Tax=Cyanophyceae TaxID=3028117 RepID=UPI001687A26D|nr:MULTISPECIES: branched-chain amino acid ABC transporter permease [Cyanophyceae]MBD1868143.1 branched-chain amino acid ABC transporter permease [Cyanobacteria bacterium FACHB-471]MBD1995828.1 branched-chain amino acid ABC transporter permease [Leptolyngbya sp. FACHB-541]MBD2059262.1 branched-chain amino acid ABC transporter permease [Oculatella sp. FACHB-28]MBD2069354.1 branched-chain amino acid ABC transporter permease [Leptolyngbya sp. FACHB-671]